MYHLDEQEKKIITELVRNPRISDNQLGKRTRVPIRTVSRKRNKLEEEGIISYFSNINMRSNGTARFGARQLHVIRFKLGITREQIMNEIKEEKMVRMSYGKYIYESHLAEIEGHIALILIIEGKSDEHIVENFNKEIVPSLMRNHGRDSIEKVFTIRLSDPIRIFHNYLPLLNMEKGFIKKDWPDELIFVE